MSKRIICIILCLAMLFACLSCGQRQSEVQPTEKPQSLSPTKLPEISFEPLPSTAFSPTPAVSKEATELFTELDNDIFSWYVTQNYSVLDQFVSDPSVYNLDISNVPVTLGVYSNDYAQLVKKRLQSYLDRLNEIDPDRLDLDYGFAYATVKQFLEFQIEAADFFIFNEPLDLYVGTQMNLPVFFCLFKLESKDDVDKYLMLLQDVQRYLEQILIHEQKRADKGIFMTQRALDAVLLSISKIVNSGESCSLISTFEQAIQRVPDISAEEREQYCLRQRDMVASSYLAAFSTLYEGLETLRPSCREGIGLSSVSPQAQEYLDISLKIESSSDITMNDARGLLESTIEDLQLTLAGIYAADPTVFDFPASFSRGSVQADEQYLKEIMTAYVPDAPAVSVSYFNIPEELRASYSPAAYEVPTLDKWAENRILINPRSKPDFLTMAHEAYSGHLYQLTYLRAKGNVSKTVQIIDPIGYYEGWAMSSEYYAALYADFFGTDYAQSVCLDSHLRILFGALSSVLVNYYGFSQENLAEYLDGYGMENYAYSLYVKAVDMPTYYFKYALGFCCQMDIAASCESVTIYELNMYHEAYLNLGVSYFNLIKPRMVDWADKKGA